MAFEKGGTIHTISLSGIGLSHMCHCEEERFTATMKQSFKRSMDCFARLWLARNDTAAQVPRKQQKAQVVLEFLFCMVVLLLIIYGCIMAIRWGGVSMVQVGIDHNRTLTEDGSETWVERTDAAPYRQLDPAFYSESPMGLVFNKW